MLQQAASRNAARSVLRTEGLPPALGGWNARDPVASMKPGDAILLDNWICRTDGLHLRPGCEQQCTALNGAVQSLLPYYGARGDALFAATPTALYNIEQPETAVQTGLTSGIWSSVVQSNPGGTFLLACNGRNTPRIFNGFVWSNAAITSAQTNRALTSSNLFSICLHMRRPFFAEANSLRIWYLGVDAIQGPAHLIDLAPLCRLGSHIVAIASLTTDGARNTNDRLVAVTDQGEMVVFGGVDPTRSTTWSLVGVYSVPPPIGPRCLLSYGGDLAYLSTSGMLSSSAIMATPDPDKPLTAMTDKIRNAYQTAQGVGDSAIWCLAESTRHRLTLINAPSAAGSAQMVRSADGAKKAGWSSFSGLNALCWASFGSDLYFGRADGTVWRLGGDRDGGAAITASCIEAYGKLGTSAYKTASRIRPVFNTSTALKARMELRRNFEPVTSGITAPSTVYAGQPWTWPTLTSWDQTPTAWTREIRAKVEGWRGISGAGHALALAFSVSALGPVTYAGSELAFQTGGGL